MAKVQDRRGARRRNRFFAALTSGAYVRSPGEKIAVVICGGNADPASFA
ncbi:hypothetical protein [Paraburkholderia sp. SIMBA_053]